MVHFYKIENVVVLSIPLGEEFFLSDFKEIEKYLYFEIKIYSFLVFLQSQYCVVYVTLFALEPSDNFFLQNLHHKTQAHF